MKAYISLFMTCICLVSLLSCSSPATRKVLIIGRGGITVAGNNVTMDDRLGYVEKTVDAEGDKEVAWNVETPAGKRTITIPEEKGFYILNLKTDTIVGSRQNIGTDLVGGIMTQEDLKLKIDSLTKLVTGSNVSLGGKNYFILPNQLIKISASKEAKVYGPFTKIPASFEADKNGEAPEIYKFYTNTEMRALIVNLKKQTI